MMAFSLVVVVVVAGVAVVDVPSPLKNHHH
jgi:hypothetical protein